jgi:hypothetical protein
MQSPLGNIYPLKHKYEIFESKNKGGNRGSFYLIIGHDGLSFSMDWTPACVT